jgi:hypothetical protein
LVRDDGVYKRGKLWVIDWRKGLGVYFMEDGRVDWCVLEDRAAIQVESDNSK